jgi:hypothetical protein
LGCAVALDVVALQATRHEVLPLISAASGSWDHVVNRAGRSIAVGTAVSVPTEYTSSGDRDMAVVGHLHVTREDDHGGSLPGAIGTSHRITLIALNDDSAAIHDEHEGAPEGHHRERFIAGI